LARGRVAVVMQPSSTDHVFDACSVTMPCRAVLTGHACAIWMWCDLLRCFVLSCALLTLTRCAVLCCAVLCCAVLCCAVLCRLLTVHLHGGGLLRRLSP
jgi:hypothetical protein